MSNFWQDKWVKDQLNRTEAKERERLERMKKREGEDAAKKPPTEAEKPLGT